MAESVCQAAARVLIVDDEAGIRDVLSDALACPGRTIATAASGRDAISEAKASRPDLIICDIMLGDSDGLDVIAEIHDSVGDIPAIVITAYRDPQVLTAASRCRPVEVMTKPLDIQRLQGLVESELKRVANYERSSERNRRLRLLARRSNIQRKRTKQKFEQTRDSLCDTYRALTDKLAIQSRVIEYQQALISAHNDDDVFENLFRFFVHCSGAVFGAAMVCDSESLLRVVGRFGVPKPDSLPFCERLADPIIDKVMAEPRSCIVDCWDRQGDFPAPVRRFLPGMSLLAMPLLPVENEMIGLVMFYRKGEQPFTEADVMLAELLSPSTAAAIQRNE